MDLDELRCAFTRQWLRYIRVQSAHQKADRHVVRMQAVKPTGSREALDAALRKRERTGYALLACGRKLDKLRSELLSRTNSSFAVLCSAGIKGECKGCRSHQRLEQRLPGDKPRDPRRVQHRLEDAIAVQATYHDNQFEYSGSRLRPLDLEVATEGPLPPTLSLLGGSPDE